MLSLLLLLFRVWCVCCVDVCHSVPLLSNLLGHCVWDWYIFYFVIIACRRRHRHRRCLPFLYLLYICLSFISNMTTDDNDLCTGIWQKYFCVRNENERTERMVWVAAGMAMAYDGWDRTKRKQKKRPIIILAVCRCHWRRRRHRRHWRCYCPLFIFIDIIIILYTFCRRDMSDPK